MSKSDVNTQGVAGLKKHDIKISGIVFPLYCLAGAGAFGIEEMIPEAGSEEWKKRLKHSLIDGD